MRLISRSPLGRGAKAAAAVAVAVAAAVLLPVAVQAGAATVGTEWRLVPWDRNALLADPPAPGKDLPTPGKDLPAPGTVLPPVRPAANRQAANADAIPQRVPEASLQADPSVQAGRKLHESLTDAQRAALGQVLDRHRDRLAGLAERLPKPPVDPPASQAQADRLRTTPPPALDPAALQSATTQLEQEIAQANDEIARILTPEQRALFEQATPRHSHTMDAGSARPTDPSGPPARPASPRP